MGESGEEEDDARRRRGVERQLLDLVDLRADQHHLHGGIDHERDQVRHHRTQNGPDDVLRPVHVHLPPGRVRQRARVLRRVQEQDHADSDKLVYYKFGTVRHTPMPIRGAVHTIVHLHGQVDLRQAALSRHALRSRVQCLHIHPHPDFHSHRQVLRHHIPVPS